MIVDTHAHLEMFGDSAGQAVLRAEEAGVGAIVSVSTTVETALKTAGLAAKFSSVYAAVGIHPHAASTFCGDSVKRLTEAASREKVTAIGETGLDYHRQNSPRDRQIESFEAHADMARNLGLPLVVHMRGECENDVAAILKNGAKGVIHCFSGTYETAKKFLDLGMFISFSGILTFKNASEVRSAAKKIPACRILIETDSPYLAPVPMRGKENQPAFVRHVFDTLVQVRQTPSDELEERLFLNSLKLFSRIKTPLRAG